MANPAVNLGSAAAYKVGPFIHHAVMELKPRNDFYPFGNAA